MAKAEADAMASVVVLEEDLGLDDDDDVTTVDEVAVDALLRRRGKPMNEAC